MARRRIQSGLSNVHSHVSNNLVMLQDAWAGDHMDFQARLLGQSTTGSVDVTDDQVRLEVQLPWVLAMVTIGSPRLGSLRIAAYSLVDRATRAG